jgi:hypothetical protein
MDSPQMWLNMTYKHTQGERDRERGPTRTNHEGTREEPLDGAGCNLGACVCSSYRWSSMVVIENMKREIEGSERGVVPVFMPKSSTHRIYVLGSIVPHI